MDAQVQAAVDAAFVDEKGSVPAAVPALIALYLSDQRRIAVALERIADAAASGNQPR